MAPPPPLPLTAASAATGARLRPAQCCATLLSKRVRDQRVSRCGAHCGPATSNEGTLVCGFGPLAAHMHVLLLHTRHTYSNQSGADFWLGPNFTRESSPWRAFWWPCRAWVAPLTTRRRPARSSAPPFDRGWPTRRASHIPPWRWRRRRPPPQRRRRVQRAAAPTSREATASCCGRRLETMIWGDLAGTGCPWLRSQVGGRRRRQNRRRTQNRRKRTRAAPTETAVTAATMPMRCVRMHGAACTLDGGGGVGLDTWLGT